MKNIATLIIVSLSAFLIGCAGTPQQPVDVSESFWQNPDKKVGIVMSAIPKANVHLPGAACLLCIAVAEAANSSISKQVESFGTESLDELPKVLSETLHQNQIPFVVINEPVIESSLPKFRSKEPNTPKRDFSEYKSNHDITHLLVVDVKQVGIIRNYANYIPTSDPQAIFNALSYLVDLNNNTYTWYKPVNIRKSVSDGWDEPPAFPGLTNAYYQAIELGKESIVTPLATMPSGLEYKVEADTKETANVTAGGKQGDS